MPDDYEDIVSAALGTSAPKRRAPTKIAFQPPNATWSPDRITELKSYYKQAFGKDLPVASLGQGPVHNRMGLDHRGSADISLEPSSAEGQQLMNRLRESNIPFLAFNRAVPGASTGPHIHIGRPSHRIGTQFNIGTTEDSYDDVVGAALGKQAPAKVDSYDDVVSAALQPQQPAKAPETIVAEGGYEQTQPGQPGVKRPVPQEPQGIGTLRQSDEREIARQQRIRKQIRQEAPIATNPLTAQDLLTPRLNIDDEVQRRAAAERAQEQGHAAERARLEAQFTPEDRQQIEDIAKQLRRHGGGVKRGIDVPIQRTASSLLYKIAGLTDIPTLGQGDNPLGDALRRKALAGELAVEDIQNLPKPHREKVAEFLTSLAAGLPEITAATALGGPVGGFAALHGLEAVGRKAPAAEVAKETAKGATLGAVFRGAGATSIPKELATIGAGTYATEKAFGATEEQALQSAGTNVLFGGATHLARKAGETGAQKPTQRFYHKDWGEVEVVPDQTGAKAGKVKVAVVGKRGEIHYPKESDLRGVGNARMVPVKPAEPPPVQPAEIPERYGPDDAERQRIKAENAKEIEAEREGRRNKYRQVVAELKRTQNWRLREDAVAYAKTTDISREQVIKDLVDAGIPLEDAEGATRTIKPAAPKPIETPTPPSTEATPSARVQTVPVSELHLDPERFQFKAGHNKKGGTGSLADVRVWDENLAGVVAVWRDPADGKTYVVNGHNRLEKAQDLGVKNVDVRYIDAPNAKTARGVGATISIAEGNGTAVDAATFFRDFGLDEAALRKQGIPLTKSVARDGLALSKLDDFVFNAVKRGDLSEDYGAAIGNKISNPDLQAQAYKAIAKASEKGKPLSKAVVEEMVDTIGAAPRQTETEQSLFGDFDTERSLFTERAQVSAAIKRQLSQDKTLFGTAARKSGRLAEGGTTVDVEQAKALQESATEALGVFDTLKNRTGKISEILDQGAKSVASGKRPDQVAKESYDRIKQAVNEAIRGGDRTVVEGSARVPERPENEVSQPTLGEPPVAPPSTETPATRTETTEAAPPITEPEKFGPGAASAKEPFPEVKERKFGIQLMGDEALVQELKDSLGTSRYYEPIPNKVTAEEATKFIEKRGIPESIKAIKDESNDLPFHVRSAIGQLAIKRLNSLFRKLQKSSPSDAEFVLDQTTDLAEWAMAYGTRLGQGVQSFAMWARLTPEGKLLTFKRMVDKARAKHTKKTGDEVQQILEGMNKPSESPEVDAASRAAVKDTVTKKVREGARKAARGDLSVWQQYKDAIARQLANVVNPHVKAEPPLQEFSKRLLKNVEGLIAKPEKAKEPDDVYGKMREVVENFDKYKDAWNEAIEFVRAKYDTKSLEELAEMERRITDLHSAFQTKAFDKVFDDAVKQAELNFRDLAKAHYSQTERTRTGLIERIQKELGIELSPEEAQSLINRIEQRLETKIIAARQGILKGMAQRGNKTAQKILPLTDRIVEAARVGVLNEQQFYDLASERLGLPKYDKTVAQGILERAAKIEDAAEGIPRDQAVLELNRYMAIQKGFSPWDVPLGIYYGNILSGYNTHAVNTVDTLGNVVSEINGMALQNPRAGSKIYGGLLRGFAEGRLDALFALTEGRMASDDRWLEGRRLMEVAQFGKKGGVPVRADTRTGRAIQKMTESWGGYPLNAYKYVGRALAASDAVMYRAAKEARANLLAYRMAQAEGLKGEAADKRMLEILALDRPSDFLVEAKREGLMGRDAELQARILRDMARDKGLESDAAEFAGEATYNHKPHGRLGQISGVMSRLSEDVPALKFFVPFTQIVANVTNRGLNYTPYGFKRAQSGYGGSPGSRTWEGYLDPEARQLMLTRATLGTTGLALLGSLAAVGVLTIHGGGPSEPKRRKQLVAAGWRPYSLQMGNVFIPYNNTPIGLGLSIIGNIADTERYHELDQRDVLSKVGYSVARVGSTIFSQSFLSGLSRLFDALSNEPSSAVRGVKQSLSSTVGALTTPNLTRDVIRLFDNKAYQSNSLIEDMVRSTPFAAAFLKPQLNAFGEPVRLQRQRFADVLTSDPTWRFVIEKRLRVPVPSRTAEIEKGTRITPDEYYNLISKTGPRLKAWVAENQKMLDDMPEQEAQDELSKASGMITKDEMNKLRDEKGVDRSRKKKAETGLTRPEGTQAPKKSEFNLGRTFKFIGP